MKNLTIKKIDISSPVSVQEAAQLLTNETDLENVDILNWEKAYPYKPGVQFRIAHTGNEIWLKFYVQEKNILAQETEINGDVYKDSTVEFFISVDEGKNYYNFEFNCIGTPHVGYGPGRGNRTPILPEVINQIDIESTLGNEPFEEKSGNFSWEMMICIPVQCFAFDKIENLGGLKATANFYKCGDATSDPHFVTWNAVDTENPDYHRPEFFGQINFEE
ncbi:carbohydrate-binding family 9-like protein [uncultured Draconibacterium sp.]|uniref:carbohydrate-binding family 9-like protein n=1 Tax=uncultured Draconibacterium sp. TaxID=1573823 RepID=UPI002AA65402|nr:carbohydrate-binding family 9-like protein [uncultured Draconibacterium sp.]